MDIKVHMRFTGGLWCVAPPKPPNQHNRNNNLMCDVSPADLSVAVSPGPGYLSPEPLSKDACLGSSPPRGLLSDAGVKSPEVPW